MLEDILKYLHDKDIDVISSNDKEIITKHIIGAHTVQIKGLWTLLEKHQLPRYFLCDREQYGLLAHIGWDSNDNIGLCCSGSDDVLSLNYKEPFKIYYEALLRNLNMLIPVLHDQDENNKQIMSEYLGHLNWVESKEYAEIMLIVEFLPGINKLDMYKQNNPQQVIITHKESSLDEFYTFKHKIKKHYNKTKCSFLIELEELTLPPKPTDNLKDWWKGLLTVQGEDFYQTLELATSTIRSNTFYFICYKKLDDEVITFCVAFHTTRSKDFAPINNNMNNWDINIVKIVQHTKEFLLPRSGGRLDFQEKKVLLVGCGSVGSFISKQLVQSGIGELVLSDPDKFELGNLYRHNLGAYYHGYLKSKSLHHSLSNDYPYTKILSKSNELMEIPKDILIEQDLIIVAIGNPTQERLFNEYLKTEEIKVNVLYVWLEGFGLGGHVVFVEKSFNHGCLQCNYLDLNEEVPILHSNMNFLYPNQDVAKDLGGCGTLFLPYSHLDAEQTALLSSRIAIDILDNKLTTSIRVSWKGPKEDAESRGLELTHRYQRYDSLKYEEYKQEFCYVCSH